MKPPPQRKLRGAQRVVTLQADAERLYAQARQLDEAEQRSRGPKQVRFFGEGAEWLAARDAYSRAREAMAALHALSPKRAIAVAAKLGLIKQSWWTLLPRSKRARYRDGGRINDLQADPLPVRSASTQRKLKKIVEAEKQAKKRKAT